MFLGGDSPRKAADFGIPKRGNFRIPKWDFFFRLMRRAFAGGNRPAVSDVFLSGSAASGRINCARLAHLVKLEGRAFGQRDSRTASLFHCSTHGLRNARLPVPTPPQASHKNEIGYRDKDEHTAVPPVESPGGSEGGRET
ncbi:hypothetical protein AB9E33_14205 [Rhizobium leguminosarum]